MIFDQFVNTLVVAYIRDEFMQNEIKAAGIDFEKLPAKLIGVPTIKAYFEKRKTKSHPVAAFELEKDLALLERFAEPLTAIPRDPQVLRDKFQEYFDAYQFQILADELRRSPEDGKELIKQFQLREAKAVQYQCLTELIMLVGHQHIAAREKKSVVTVKGFEKLSEMIGGFNPERLGIFLGGTGFGKTNFAVNLSLAAAQSMNVAYVNMEMGYADMVKRFAVIGGRVSYNDYASGNFDPNQVADDLLKVSENIQITSGRTLTFDQITSWVRMLHQQRPVGLLVIDYDQKVDLNLRHQVEEWKALQRVMESFEDLAKDLQLYVLILAQVNRDGLISGSHRAQFPAHTVLAFYEHETLGPVIEARKNRHGRKNQAVSVHYDERNSNIIESEIVTVQRDRPAERKQLKPKEKNQPWWGKE